MICSIPGSSHDEGGVRRRRRYFFFPSYLSVHITAQYSMCLLVFVRDVVLVYYSILRKPLINRAPILQCSQQQQSIELCIPRTDQYCNHLENDCSNSHRKQSVHGSALPNCTLIDFPASGLLHNNSQRRMVPSDDLPTLSRRG